MAKVSVIMSTYNDQEYIREAIDSILNQSFSDFEFIIIDDSSSDSTLSIIKDYNDKRIRLIANEENKGLTRNLNTALKLASGIYIARMDGDDISHLDRFKIQVDYLDSNPDVYLIGTAVKDFGESDLYWFLPDDSEELRIRMLLHPVFAHPSFMFRKELLTEGFYYDESFRTAQDYDFAVRVSRTHKIGRVKEILLNYRVHSKQISNTSGINQNNNADIIRHRLMSELGVIFTDAEERIFNDWVSERKLNSAKEYKNAYKIIDLYCEKNKEVKVYDEAKLEHVLKKMLYTWVIRSKKIGFIIQMPYICKWNLQNMKIFIGELIRTVQEKAIRDKR